MLISVKQLNSPGTSELQLEVSPTNTVQEVKSRLAEQLRISVNQQKLVFKGKALHDGLLSDCQINDGAKLHLIISPQTSADSPFVKELHLLASKWTTNPSEREMFVTTFQREMKMTVDQLSLDDIEKLCTDRLNQRV